MVISMNAKLSPPGYTNLHKACVVRSGGGVAFLLCEGCKAQELKALAFASLEHLAISTARDCARFVVIYRPPSTSLATFLEEFTMLLEDLALGGSSLVISGYFNLHFENQSPYVKKFIQLCDTFGLIQHVNSATYVKGHTLDLIIRDSDFLAIGNIRVEDVSDHFLVCCDIVVREPPHDKRMIVIVTSNR